MRKQITKGVTILAIASTAACTPMNPSSNGPDSDFFGNPAPTSCAVNGGSVPPLPPAPPLGEVPAGWRNVEIEIEVGAIGTNKYGGISQVCIPFDAQLYGRADEAELVFVEGGKAVVTPWNGVRATPWRMVAYLQYNPAARPSLVNWQLDLLASFNPLRPDNPPMDPTWAPLRFFCNVLVDGKAKFGGLGPHGPEETVIPASGSSPSSVRCNVFGQN
jgi:hypothetical protein